MPAIPPRFNLARACLERQARDSSDKVALIVVTDSADIAGAERWTYTQLDHAVRSVAAGLLARGLKPGDRIVLQLPNNSDYALLFFGAIAAGLVPVPISAQLTEPEAAYLIENAEAAAVAGGAGHHSGTLDADAIAAIKSTPPLLNYADTAADDPAYMIYTSGTGSRPKGVVHAQRVLLGRAPMRSEWEAVGPTDIMLHAGAFNWSYTLGVGLLDPWCVGACAMLYAGPKDIQVWPRLIHECGVTVFAAVPGLYRQILKYSSIDEAAFSTLRHALVAGEALPTAVLSAWQEATGREIYEAFGMSECSTFVSSGPATPVRPGSAGKPQQGRRVAILPIEQGDAPLPAGETGLLAIHRSEPGLMLGYWRRPDEDAITSRGDWFVGGDLASLDADGYLWHHGRADDTMNAGGYRVSPAEVEAAFAGMPGITEIAVKEHRVRNDLSIIAAWAVRETGSAIGEAEILAFAESKLAAYKRPKQVTFVDALPRSSNGKLLRRLLV